MVEKILWLRQQYHFGPQKIAMYLKRYHDLTISSSGVWRIHAPVLGKAPTKSVEDWAAPVLQHGLQVACIEPKQGWKIASWSE